MASITGIELKPDSCALAALRLTREPFEVFAIHTISPADWPEQEAAISDALRAVRTRLRLPRRAAVTDWRLSDHTSTSERTTLDLLRPLTTAGFTIQSVISPPRALLALAAWRPRPAGGAAVAWLALNMHGAAMAIVHGSELLYAHSLDWLYSPGAAGSSAQLLQRYSLVARLAPELRHADRHDRAAHGIGVDTAVTCGDLPELRSMTMQLIDELDLEVETLDSTEGLRPTERARDERFVELAPAIRLACAAVLEQLARTESTTATRPWIPAALAAAVLAVAAGYVQWNGRGPSSVVSTDEPRSDSSFSRAPAPSAVVLEAPETTAGVQPAVPLASPPSEQSGAASADKNHGAFPSASSRLETSATPQALTEPIPRVDSVLIDGTRRLAIVDGAIRGVGDSVGMRTIARIDRAAIVLREPSGLEVEVALRPFGARL
jgi:hypothetical protein